MCRRVRELHFVDIVDVEQLLQAMAHDVPQVAHRIQKLLLPSYFPGLQSRTLGSEVHLHHLLSDILTGLLSVLCPLLCPATSQVSTRQRICWHRASSPA